MDGMERASSTLQTIYQVSPSMPLPYSTFSTPQHLRPLDKVTAAECHVIHGVSDRFPEDRLRGHLYAGPSGCWAHRKA